MQQKLESLNMDFFNMQIIKLYCNYYTNFAKNDTGSEKTDSQIHRKMLSS